MWSGALNQIPTGWSLCNGNNGTPNLSDRFIVGVGNAYSLAATGGEASHLLTSEESGLPSHSHSLPGVLKNVYGGSWDVHVVSNSNISIDYNSGAVAASNASRPHNTLPPYYALAFIMKL